MALPMSAPQSMLFNSSSNDLLFSKIIHKRYMEGVVVTTAQLKTEDKALVAAWLELTGGTYDPILSSHTTHLVCISSSGPKYKSAKEMIDNGNSSLFIMGIEWVHSCMTSRQHTDEFLFTLSFLEPVRERERKAREEAHATQMKLREEELNKITSICSEMSKTFLTDSMTSGKDKLALYDFSDDSDSQPEENNNKKMKKKENAPAKKKQSKPKSKNTTKEINSQREKGREVSEKENEHQNPNIIFPETKNTTILRVRKNPMLSTRQVLGPSCFTSSSSSSSSNLHSSPAESQSSSSGSMPSSCAPLSEKAIYIVGDQEKEKRDQQVRDKELERQRQQAKDIEKKKRKVYINNNDEDANISSLFFDVSIPIVSVPKNHSSKQSATKKFSKQPYSRKSPIKADFPLPSFSSFSMTDSSDVPPISNIFNHPSSYSLPTKPSYVSIPSTNPMSSPLSRPSPHLSFPPQSPHPNPVFNSNLSNSFPAPATFLYNQMDLSFPNLPNTHNSHTLLPSSSFSSTSISQSSPTKSPSKDTLRNDVVEYRSKYPSPSPSPAYSPSSSPAYSPTHSPSPSISRRDSHSYSSTDLPTFVPLSPRDSPSPLAPRRLQIPPLPPFSSLLTTPPPFMDSNSEHIIDINNPFSASHSPATPRYTSSLSSVFSSPRSSVSAAPSTPCSPSHATQSAPPTVPSVSVSSSVQFVSSLSPVVSSSLSSVSSVSKSVNNSPEKIITPSASPATERSNNFQFTPPPPMQPLTHRKRGHETEASDNDKQHENQLFMYGLVFVLGKYNELIKASIETKLKACGASVSETFTNATTHFLSQFLPLSPVPPGVTLVSSDWLHDVLTCQRVLPPTKFLHKPVPRYGVIDLRNAVISISGFVGQERSDMKGLIAATQATFTPYLSSQNTHIICKYGEGKKYEKAMEWGRDKIKIVNQHWLEDVMATWTYPNPNLERYQVLPAPKRQFMISGAKDNNQINDFKRIIAKLGGVLLGNGQSDYNPACTHLITLTLKPTEKLLCACAAGVWVLKPNFLYESEKEGKFLSEENYAWQGWADRWRSLNLLPFARLSVFICGQSHLATLFRAGGGEAYLWNQDMPSEVLNKIKKEKRKIDFVIIGKNEQMSETLAREVLANHWSCFSSQFLIAYLIHDKQLDMDKYKVKIDANTKKQKVIIEID